MAINMTQEQKFEKSLPKEGKHLARLVEYIETGNQKTKFGDKPDVVRFGFELLSPADIYEHEGEKRAPIFRPHPVQASRSAKSNVMKLFKGLNYKQDKSIKGFDQLIGVPCIINIQHREKQTPNKDGTKPVYATLDFSSDSYAPVQHDVLTGHTKDIEVHPQINKSRVFDYSNPTTESWDALFIPGTKENGESKNWLQEEILNATNHSGSALEKLLQSADNTPSPVPESTPAPKQSDIEDLAVPTSTSETPPAVEDPLAHLK